MSNVRLVTSNDGDVLTLSSVPAAVSTLPITNLQNGLRARLARIPSTSASIYADAPTELTADFIAIANHNLDPQAILRARLFDGAGQTGSTVYDSGETPIDTIIPWSTFRFGVDPWASFVDDQDFPTNFPFTLPAPVVYRSLQLDIVNGNTPIEIARLFVGQSVTVSVNYDYGASLAWVESTTYTRTEGGSLHVEPASRYRRVEFRLQHLTDTDRIILSRELRKSGKGGDVLLSLQPDRTDEIGREETFIGKLVNNLTFTTINTNRHGVSLVFEGS